MQESWEREQEGCQSVSFRDVSEWLSFLPPGNFYFRVKEAPLLTKLRKIRVYSRQYFVTWQTPWADPFGREERVALAHGFTPYSFGPVAFGSRWGSLSWWGVFGRQRWHLMTPGIHSSWVWEQPNSNENNRVSEVSYHSPSKWRSWIPMVVINIPPTVETPTFNLTVCLNNTRGVDFLKKGKD